MRHFLDQHRATLVFLAKMLACYAAWYAAYEFWLLPDGRLNAFVAENAAILSGHLLDAFGAGAVRDGRVLRIGTAGVFVADDCTGMSTVGLFIGFVLAFPGVAWRRALFLPLGILAIHLANVGRIAALAWLLAAYPEFFHAAHEWGLLPFFYAVVFVLWMVWVRFGAPTERSARAEPVAVS